MAGQTTYTQKIADYICESIADGKSLREICKADDMPSRATVFKWLNDIKGFSDQYARAREEQAETLADEIVGIADEECTMIKKSKHTNSSEDDDSEENEIEVVFDSAAVARNRLRMEARKWVASKLKPKKYGDKVELNGPGENGEHISKVVVEFIGG
jgi:hypothetical protein